MTNAELIDALDINEENIKEILALLRDKIKKDTVYRNLLFLLKGKKVFSESVRLCSGTITPILVDFGHLISEHNEETAREYSIPVRIPNSLAMSYLLLGCGIASPDEIDTEAFHQANQSLLEEAREYRKKYPIDESSDILSDSTLQQLIVYEIEI